MLVLYDLDRTMARSVLVMENDAQVLAVKVNARKVLVLDHDVLKVIESENEIVVIEVGDLDVMMIAHILECVMKQKEIVVIGDTDLQLLAEFYHVELMMMDYIELVVVVEEKEIVVVDEAITLYVAFCRVLLNHILMFVVFLSLKLSLLMFVLVCHDKNHMVS
jgi:hypothetical protein